jgi:diguanylate cyclase (GGDEF)-like protein
VRAPGSRAVWLLVGVLALAAAALSTALPGLPGAPLDTHLPWPLLLVAFALADACAVHVRLGKELSLISLDELPLVVGLFFVDPVTLVAVRLAGRGIVLLLRRYGPLKVGFNLAQWWLDGALAVLLWSVLTAGRDVLGPVGWLGALGVVLAVDLVATVAIALAVRLSQGGRLLQLFWSCWSTGVLVATAKACLGLVATAVVVVDWRASWTLAVVGGVLFVAHRGHEGLRSRQEALERLNGFTQRVSAGLAVEDLAHTVMLEVRDLLNAARAEVVLGDAAVLACDRDGALTRIDGAGESIAHRLRGRLPEHAVLVRRSTREPLLKAWLAEVGVRDAVVVPLRVDDRLVGALSVADKLGDAGTFTTADRQVLETLANHAAVAIENARLTGELRTQVAEQRHRARHDALTGLPNREHLLERMTARLAEGASFAVLLLDLDRFQDVNDTLGHAAGDALLVLVAERLAELSGPDVFLSRLGGDEFVVLAPADSREQGEEVARRVGALLGRPFAVAGMAVAVPPSIGIAVTGIDGLDHSTLLRRADIAMYAAKQHGTGLSTYSAEVDEHTAERLAMVAELRTAVATDALTVHFQPKVDLVDGRVRGVEALARWAHPQRGFIPPDQFIPVAERTGLIVDLTRRVLDTALAQCAAWRAAGTELGVAVNLSPRVLQSGAFEGELAAMLARHGVPAGLLTLEVTESSLMSDVARTATGLARLRDLGVHLSIDDLGTGYSSLAYLKQLPVDEIKLDKSFVLGIAGDRDDCAIVRAMVEVGHQLGMRVVAEGVEDEESFSLLRTLGCDVGQGYWMSRPLPAADVLPWVAAWSGGRGVPGQRRPVVRLAGPAGLVGA